jgi:hypothetical protein
MAPRQPVLRRVVPCGPPSRPQSHSAACHALRPRALAERRSLRQPQHLPRQPPCQSHLPCQPHLRHRHATRRAASHGARREHLAHAPHAPQHATTCRQHRAQHRRDAQRRQRRRRRRHEHLRWRRRRHRPCAAPRLALISARRKHPRRTILHWLRTCRRRSSACARSYAANERRFIARLLSRLGRAASPDRGQ